MSFLTVFIMILLKSCDLDGDKGIFLKDDLFMLLP